MDAPLGLSVFLWVGMVLVQFILGYFIVRAKIPQAFLWLLPITVVLIAHYIFLDTSALIRMIALIVPLLHSMKILVANRHPNGKMSFSNWVVFYFLTVNMNPKIMAKRQSPSFDTKLLSKALLHIIAGSLVLFLLRNYVDIQSASLAQYWVCSFMALFALSLILHFGLLSLNTVALKWFGIADYSVFKQPFKSQSLSEFWGSRWNLAFSEMTATAVFKPLAKSVGVRKAGFLSFMVSGLLHEIAISFSVMSGYGLPMLYFVLHGVFMAFEKKLFSSKKPGTIWVILCLVLPMPLLFHQTFLEEVIWKLIYLGK